jgi:hypothetical protein
VYYFQELYRKTDLLQFYFDSSNEKTQVTAWILRRLLTRLLARKMCHMTEVVTTVVFDVGWEILKTTVDGIVSQLNSL